MIILRFFFSLQILYFTLFIFSGIFWMSIIVFNFVLLPSLEFLTHVIVGGSTTHSAVWGLVGPLLSWTFSALWILPLFVLSKVVNSLWFQDIADQAYKRSRGRPQTFPSLGKALADILFSLLLQSFFLIQGMLASLLPLPGIGYFVSTVHMCLLYSLYAFEYSWYNRGWEVHKRLAYIESGWPYFVGFGFPLALLTAMPSSYIISGCVFSILFPLFIISANEADTSCATFEYPLKLFGLVIQMSNAVFRHSLTKSTRAGGQPSSTKGTPVKQVKVAETKKQY